MPIWATFGLVFLALIVAGFVLTFLALIVAGTVQIRRRTRRIAASRPGENLATFCASFGAEEVPQDVLKAVHAKFQEWCSDAVRKFPVRAADDIGSIYGMVDEDLDDALVDVVRSCGRRLPPLGELRHMRSVVTVRDFVLFVSGCPRRVKRGVSRDARRYPGAADPGE
jgi:hypothetical protein